MGYDPERDDPGFEGDLRESEDAVLFAAKLLRHRGHPVSIAAFEVRGDVEDRYDYQDEADLWASRPIEVKHRDLDFTCAQDYPYPSVFIDEKYKFNADAWFYLILNEDLTHFVFAEVQDRPLWREIERKSQGTTRTWLSAPTNTVDFCKVPNEIQ